MTTSKTLTLKKPLSFEQKAKLFQTLQLNLPAKKLNKEKTDKKRENESEKTEKSKNLENPHLEQKEMTPKERARLKKDALYAAIEWLCQTYPNCFHQENPKPLNVGIFDDILQEGLWPYSKTALRRTLGFYTNSPAYNKSLVQLSERYSLNGDPSQGIKESEKAYAMEKLHSWEVRMKGKKKKEKSKDKKE